MQVNVWPGCGGFLNKKVSTYSLHFTEIYKNWVRAKRDCITGLTLQPCCIMQTNKIDEKALLQKIHEPAMTFLEDAVQTGSSHIS